MNYLTSQRVFFFIICSMISFVAASQPTPDSRLGVAFSPTELAAMTSKQLAQHQYELDNGWFLTTFPKEKGDIAQFQIIEIKDVEKINIVALLKNKIIVRHPTKLQAYRIVGTDKDRKSVV